MTSNMDAAITRRTARAVSALYDAWREYQDAAADAETVLKLYTAKSSVWPAERWLPVKSMYESAWARAEALFETYRVRFELAPGPVLSDWLAFLARVERRAS